MKPVICLLSVLWLTLGVADAEPIPTKLLERIDRSLDEPQESRRAEAWQLNAGPLSLRFEPGVVTPAGSNGTGCRELLFDGRGVLELSTDDPVEAGQLELFTGSERLEEPFDDAVLVLCSDLDDGSPALGDPAPTPENAPGQLRDWGDSIERKLAGASHGMLRRAMGDTRYNTYIAARVTSDELGEILVVVDPGEVPEVLVGQFVPLDMTEREKDRAGWHIRRQQRRGRLSGISQEDLGNFDTWFQAAGRDPGADYDRDASFEPEHYRIEASIGFNSKDLEGTASIRARATRGDSPVIRLESAADVSIKRTSLTDGTALPFSQQAGETLVFLPETPNTADKLELVVEFSGELISKVDATLFALNHTIHWHPHMGSRDRATYEVRLEWPEHLDLVMSGDPVERDSDRGRSWALHRQGVPVNAFTFEIGRFESESTQVGDIELTVSTDSILSRYDQGSAKRLLKEFELALDFLQAQFGPLPVKRMTVVTVPRGFAQGTLGLITLPQGIAYRRSDWSALDQLRHQQGRDRQSFIVHELAHQWWGNLLGARTDRDYWLNEAMASHAEILWGRSRDGRYSSAKKGFLAESTPDGRPLESLGPLTLGTRLNSSRAEAYQSIVYEKGALVVGTLSQIFGEKDFAEIQRILLEHARFRDISTETYFQALEKISGTDLQWFVERYIYGTGFPLMVYTPEFAQSEQGPWQIEVTTRLYPQYEKTCRVDAQGARADIRCALIPSENLDRVALPLPLRVIVRNPETDSKQVVSGRTLVQSRDFVIRMEIEQKPLSLVLDPHETVLGRFVPSGSAPESGPLYEATRLAAEGQPGDAIELLEGALKSGGGDDANKAYTTWKYVTEGGPPPAFQLLALIQARRDALTLLASLYMDTGQLAKAERRVEQLADGWKPFPRQTAYSQARLAWLQGDPKKCVRILRRATQDKRKNFARWLSQEEALLVALAARAEQDAGLMAKALRVAEARGADVTGLRP